MQAGSFLLSNCCHNELYITQKTQYIVFFLFQNVYIMRFYWSMGFIVGIFLGFTVSRFVALHDAVFSTASVIHDAL